MNIYLSIIAVSSLFFGIIWKTSSLFNVLCKMYFWVMFLVTIVLLFQRLGFIVVAPGDMHWF